MKKSFIYKGLFALFLSSSGWSQSEKIDWDSLEQKFPKQFRHVTKVNDPSYQGVREFLLSRDHKNEHLKKYLQDGFDKLINITKTILESTENKLLTDFLEHLEFISKKSKRQTLDVYHRALAYLCIHLSHYSLNDDINILEQKILEAPHLQTFYHNIFFKDKKLSFSEFLSEFSLKEGEEGNRIFDTYKMLKKLGLETKGYEPIPLFLPLSDSENDVMGLFTLPYSYAKGNHLVPIQFNDKVRKNGLHDVIKTAWGNMNHDFTHFLADRSAKNFGTFFQSIKDKVKEIYNNLNEEDKKKYKDTNFPKCIAEFCLEIHHAYKKALVTILEKSISVLNPKLEEELSDNFKAFTTGAFIQLHEDYPDLSKRFVTNNFGDILIESTLRDSCYYLKSPFLDQENTPFKTSFKNGTSLLSDEEIIELAKKIPFRKYVRKSLNGDTYTELSETPLDEHKKNVKDYRSAVKRNKLQIIVSFQDPFTQDAYETIITTDYIKTVNLDHDRQMIRNAQCYLKANGFSVEKLLKKNMPTENSSTKEFNDYFNMLAEKRAELVTYFGRTARNLSGHKVSDESDLTIADVFTQDYDTAIKKLGDTVPFIDNMSDFIQKLFDEEVKQDDKKAEGLHVKGTIQVNSKRNIRPVTDRKKVKRS